MERKIVITHNYKEYILPMYMQSMAYRVGEQVPNHSDKRQGLIKMLPIQQCLGN